MYDFVSDSWFLLMNINCLFINSPPIFPDLTLAMQKLYQTFVAQAAQLQSVHENVKVGSLPSANNIMLKVSLIRAVWLGIYNV